MIDPTRHNELIQNLQLTLGVPTATTVKVEAVSRNIFAQIFLSIRKGLCELFGIGAQEKQAFFNLAHEVKNNGFMTQAEFFTLQKAYEAGSEETIQVSKGITKRLYDEKVIDRTHYFKLMLMIDNGNTKLALGYLAGLSALQSINTLQKEFKTVISPKEQDELMAMLEHCYEKGSFRDSDVQLLTHLKARLEIYKWADGKEGYDEVKTAIEKNNEKLLSAALKKLDPKLTFSSFTEFNHYLTSLSYLDSLRSQIWELKDVLNGMKNKQELSDLQNSYEFFLRKEMGFFPFELFKSELKKLDYIVETSNKTNNLFAKKPSFLAGLKTLSDNLSTIPVKEIGTIKIENNMVLDGNLNWQTLKKHDEKQALFTLRMLSKQTNKEITKHYLNHLINIYKKDLDGDLRKCNKSPILVEIAKVDRALNAPNYQTEFVKKMRAKWSQEKTSNAKDHNTQETIMSEKIATDSFDNYPEHYDWIKEMHLHRHASTFNHQWTANEKGEILLPTPEGPQPVSTFITQGIKKVHEKLIDMNTGQQYIYDQTGLHKVDDKDAPTTRTANITPFKTKNRKTKDFRLEIATDTGSSEESGTHVHSYVYLKHPDGRVYSVGKFWDNDVVGTAITELGMTMPAHIQCPDVHDFMGRIKSNKNPNTNIKVTKIDLGNEANFQKALDFINKYDTKYQLTGSNCGTLPMDLAAEFKIYPKNKVTAASYNLPLSNGQRKFLVRNPWIQTLSMALLYPLKLIFNIVYIALGSLKIHPLMPDEKRTNLFPTIGAFLNPYTTLIDCPPHLRAWQDVVEEKLGKKVYSLEEMQKYTASH